MTDKTNEVREVVREVDRKTAVRLRQIQARAETAKYKAAVAKSRAEARDSAKEARFHARIELAKMRAQRTASETARVNIALTAPAILVVLIGGFIVALGTGALPDEAVATAAALLTMLASGILTNLRSLIGESQASDTNGHDDPKPGGKTK